MKTNSTTIRLTLAIGLALFLLPLNAQSGMAQTNTFPSTGSVGIGTMSPAERLQVHDNSDVQIRLVDDSALATGIGGGISFTASQVAGSPFDAAKITAKKVNATFGNSSYDLTFWTKQDSIAIAERMRISSNGNLGIGTTSPVEKVDVSGNIRASGSNTAVKLFADNGSSPQINFGNAAGTRHWALYETTGASGQQGVFKIHDHVAGLDRVAVDTSGNVGIGTTAPASLFHVYGTGNTSHAVNIDAQGSSDLQQATINLITLGDGTKSVLGTGTKGWHFTARGNTFTNATEQNDLQLYSWNGGSVSALQSWDYATGNVGIGTITPSAKLHVVGDGRVTGNLIVDGNIAAKYQDVAEWVESSQSLTAATVVVLDHTKSNQVIASSQAYDTRVAGVISAQPGIALGEKGAGKVLVATTGRVRLKVDASAGPIQIGDLLVTSNKEGVAMKSQPLNIGGVQLHRPGTLVGKALEPLRKGCGEILVLLSLQ